MIIGNKQRHRSRSALSANDNNGMQWQQFNLADVTDEMSTTGLDSVSQDTATGIWSVELDTNVASRKIGSGAQWGFKMPNAWSWADLQWAAVSIERVGTGTGLANSNFYCFAGIGLTTNPTGFNTCGAVGIYQDGGTVTTPDVGVILSTADTVNPSYSAGQAGVLGVVGEFAIGPGKRLLNCTASGVTSYNPQVWKYTKRATATTSVASADENFGFFIACGIDNTSGAGSATMNFRAHYLLSGRSGTRDANWFNNNDG